MRELAKATAVGDVEFVCHKLFLSGMVLVRAGQRWGWGDRRGGGVNPEEAGGWAGGGFAARRARRGRQGASWHRAANAAGAARAQREPAERPAGAKNGRARRAWVDSVGVPDGHTWHPLTAEKGEGLRISATGGWPSADARGAPPRRPEEKGGPANPAVVRGLAGPGMWPAGW